MSEIVAWCQQCHTWYEAEEIGNHCFFSGGTFGCETEGGRWPILVKRRMWVCREKYCNCAYASKGAFEAHEHGDCY